MLIIKKIKQMIVEILANKSKMILIRMNINQLIIIKIEIIIWCQYVLIKDIEISWLNIFLIKEFLSQ